MENGIKLTPVSDAPGSELGIGPCVHCGMVIRHIDDGGDSTIPCMGHFAVSSDGKDTYLYCTGANPHCVKAQGGVYVHVCDCGTDFIGLHCPECGASADEAPRALD